MAPSSTASTESRGRPRLRNDDEILAAALRAFADHGYDEMSLRALNIEMGLSRGTINQRFGSKDRLWRAAVDHGFRRLTADIAEELGRATDADDLALLRNTFRAVLTASWRHPEIVRLMNREGLQASDRLDYIVDGFILPIMAPVTAAMDRLAAAGRIRRTPARVVLFLLAHGAAAPFTLRALSDQFDSLDGPLDPAAYIDFATDSVLAAVQGPSAP